MKNTEAAFNFREIFAFITERHAIYERRKAGAPKPWTQDPILQQWRFCNIYRELDTVTVWIREHWREPNSTDPDLWFAMVVARLLNLPASLEAIGYPVPWKPERFKKILRERKQAGETVFNGAYMIHADATETGLKTDYLADFVLTPMWQDRERIRPKKTNTLAEFHTGLMKCRDMGSFMAGQVTADTKQVGVLKKALDWWTWAAPGPGSERGLNRVYGFPVKHRWISTIWLQHLNRLQAKLDPMLKKAGMPRICAQDLQNANCEWDKHERVRLGEGRPKQKYPGGTGSEFSAAP
jgi:hypothetical protein